MSWVEASGLANVLPPLALDAARPESWPTQRFDAVFTANTLHIMSWPEVQSLLANLPQVLADEATLVIYGPFNFAGQFTSPSNAAFDADLRAGDPRRGIRDLEAVQALAAEAGLEFVIDIPMPAPYQPDRLFHQDSLVTVQLIQDGQCWTSTFDSALTNTGLLFKARRR